MSSSLPNIIFIMTDQQRAYFTKAEGFALDTMPKLDKFSEGGHRFRRAYTSSPLCPPARCGLFSGRYPKAMRVKDNYLSGIGICKSGPDLFELLKALGYSINLCGKNHSHLREKDCDFWSPYGHHRYLGSGRLTAEHIPYSARIFLRLPIYKWHL